ncbi:MAG: hypothetical protein NWE94_06835 [Candidatus Bathyarchaeota archaeon]|nr:hypothetical protein [Candidatus Bathyarchaeota archaeon]
MAESEDYSRKELTRLIRSIAQEVACEAIDDHLEDYEHKPKKPEANELET